MKPILASAASVAAVYLIAWLGGLDIFDNGFNQGCAAFVAIVAAVAVHKLCEE